jgi:hypothetical protein
MNMTGRSGRSSRASLAVSTPFMSGYEIDERQIDPCILPAQAFECLTAARRLDNIVAGVTEHFRRRPHVAVIVDNQDYCSPQTVRFAIGARSRSKPSGGGFRVGPGEMDADCRAPSRTRFDAHSAAQLFHDPST